MEAEQIISFAQRQNRQALSEFEAKKVLAAYEIPITREILVDNAEEAVSAAREIGYPVVLKACSPKLLHKSDQGLVALNLAGDEAVRAAAERLTATADNPPEGLLVQEMIAGKRELVIGMNRDVQFGPCVMLGLGGIMTEIFKDTVFRMAPLDQTEAADMTRELKSKALLDAFRGEQPVNKDMLYHCLVAVGRIGLEHEAIAEIDINPLIITGRGDLAAVDALIILNTPDTNRDND